MTPRGGSPSRPSKQPPAAPPPSPHAPSSTPPSSGQTWDTQLPGADQATRILAAGPGPLGMHRGRIRDAQRYLDTWANRWAPAFPDSDLDMPTLRRWPIGHPSNVPRIAEAMYQHAQRLAAADHPHHVARLDAARQARQRYDAATTAYQQARRQLEQASHEPVYDTGAAELIDELTDELVAAHHRGTRADQRVATLASDPAMTSQPRSWRADGERPRRLARRADPRLPAARLSSPRPGPVHPA